MAQEKKQNNRRKNFIFKFIIVLIFLIGLGILIYPMISAVYYDYRASDEVDDFNQEVERLNEDDIDARMEKAHAYNQSLTGNEALSDFYTEAEEEEGRAMYAEMLEVNEKIGTVEIPRIHQELPIYAGTGENVLQKGVGHLNDTSLPVGGENTHSVLTAHRGLPDKKLFTDLDDMEIGDVFFVHNINETLAYEVDQIEVIEPTDFEKLRIEEGGDHVTLLTCTPYMVNSHRLIVRGHQIDYTPEVEEYHEAAKTAWWMKFFDVYRNYMIGLGIALFLFILWRVWKRKKDKDKDENND
ncbi:class C sortase [Salinicoccus cyprini]|uniref:Class C sortase n=1 Tax=Salinicoccus cyprini TaxID=2493691 RepID=A0A558AS16_9STAP|nr:class C sortase [Salinicoccus cyprini]TVT27050.1 class C sortase [Salinicoccus cyprini]